MSDPEHDSALPPKDASPQPEYSTPSPQNPALSLDFASQSPKDCTKSLKHPSPSPTNPALSSDFASQPSMDPAQSSVFTSSLPAVLDYASPAKTLSPAMRAVYLLLMLMGFVLAPMGMALMCLSALVLLIGWPMGFPFKPYLANAGICLVVGAVMLFVGCRLFRWWENRPGQKVGLDTTP